MLVSLVVSRVRCPRRIVGSLTSEITMSLYAPNNKHVRPNHKS